MGGDVYDTNFMNRCQKLKVRVFIVSYGISMNEKKFLTPTHRVSIINITSHINFITYLYNF